ncbi:quinolinate synthase NadA, partial [Akkermansia sp.]|uniref:quinolinate synthase NadA n=1 Tax=Akkermansia sp. TaxID=1872421 RepID=UPI0025C45255
KRVQRKGTHKVCILIENMEYNSIDQFGYEIIVGFKLAAARRHFDVTVLPTNLNMQAEEKYDSFMLKNGFCGAFLLGFSLHDDYIAQVHKTSVPTVLFDNVIQNRHVGSVGTDGFEGIELAVRLLADHICSTEKMIPYCTESPASSFIIVTESGILHRLRKLVPGKEFIPAPTEQCSCSTCPYMKMNTLEKLYLALRDLSPAVELPEDLRKRAEAPLLRMLEQSKS